MFRHFRLESTGMIAPIWLVIGVTIVGSKYPGYSHVYQAMSELGAAGSPTQYLSPLVNNFPVGILLLCFAFCVFRAFPGSRLCATSSFLIGIHGMASIGAGWFACDYGCQPQLPTISHQLHTVFGLVMFTSLMLASLFWIPLSTRLLQSKPLFWISLSAVIFGVISAIAMSKALHSDGMFGLYQRINYGIAMLWVFALSFLLNRETTVHR